MKAKAVALLLGFLMIVSLGAIYLQGRVGEAHDARTPPRSERSPLPPSEELATLSLREQVSLQNLDGLAIDAAGTAHFKINILGKSSLLVLSHILRKRQSTTFAPPELRKLSAGFKVLWTRMHALPGTRVRGHRVQMTLAAPVYEVFASLSAEQRASFYAHAHGLLLVSQSGDLESLLSMIEVDRRLWSEGERAMPIVLCVEGDVSAQREFPSWIRVMRGDCIEDPSESFELLLRKIHESY